MVSPTDPPAPPIPAATRLAGGAGSKWRMTIYVAWRNLWRNPFRSVLTVVAFGFSLTVMIVYGAMLDGEVYMFKDYATRLNISHFQLHRQEYIKNQDQYALLPSGLVGHLKAHLPPGYAAAPRLYAFAMASHGENSTGGFIKALDQPLEARVTSIGQKVEAGVFDLAKPLPPRNGEEAKVPPGVKVWPVAVGRQMARNLRVRPGDTLVLLTQAFDGSIANGLFRVNAILSITDPLVDRSGLVISMDAFRELMVLEEGVHEVSVITPFLDEVKLARPVLEPLLEDYLAAHPVTGDGGPVKLRSWMEVNVILGDMIQYMDGVLGVVAGLFFSIAGIGLLNTMLMSVYERRKEFAILQALGMDRRWMVVMVFLESLFLSFLASVAGTVGGLVWAQRLVEKGWDFSEYIPDGLDFSGIIFPPIIYGYMKAGSVVQVIVAMYIVAILATIIPVVRMARQKPVDVFE